MATINIIESTRSLIAQPVAQQAPSFLGESQTAVQAGVDAMLPNLCGVIAHRAGTPEGAASLLSVLHSSAVNPGLLSSDLSSVFSGGEQTQQLMESGSHLLTSLFGQKVDGMHHALATLSGLRMESAGRLLAMAAPFVLSIIKRAASANQPVTASGLSTLLASQKGYLKGHLSDAFYQALGFGGVTAWLGAEENKVAGAIHRTGSTGVREVDAVRQAVDQKSNGWLKWLPWLLLALLALLLLGFCAKQRISSDRTADTAASIPSSSVVSVASAVAPASGPAADGIPTGAGALMSMFEGRPMVKAYFETGKTDLSPDFSDKSKEVLAYLKANPAAKVSISGFTDATGDNKLNAELAKKRAGAVMDALVAVGIDAGKISLDKPADSTGTGSNDEARRVEVRIVQ
ncbi:DUF937 domain-containing protein [Burkholderia pyrrocinia]|uniref:OmpA family protein n=1 Tax=Burkholderia pyrrocinia TaxID=60550 RepID=UPI001575A336|nr:OmpA family protein [Burkholderia pyrrocinia]NTX25720.1 DUF937 domain-containing protein [Burkholderia pyrrocinia]